MNNTKKSLGDTVSYAESAEDCVKQCDVIIIATAWPQFRDIGNDVFKKTNGKSSIIDCWGLLKRDGISDVANYSQIGVGPVTGK
jgi:UDPglucose 6-dehydrogenase